MMRAANSLGARPARTFVSVVLPLTMPGVVSGCLFSFLLGLGAFVIPALLGGPSERSIAMMIESTANQQLNWNLSAALALELLAATLVFIFVQHSLFGLGTLLGAETPADAVHRHFRPIATAWRRTAEAVARLRERLQPVHVVAPTASSRASHDGLKAVMVTFAGAAALFLALPLFVVVPVSFSSAQYLQFPPPGLSLQWYERYLTNPRWLEATALSITVALIVVAVSVLVGAFAAVAAGRSGRRLRIFLAAACLAPMILPNMIIALGLFFTFAKLHLVGTVLALVLAHSLLAVPFVFITVSAGLREVDVNLERAAAVLGARPLRVFARVTIPLLRPFLLIGALFAFIVSFDEIVSALFLTSISVRTLPKMIWENIVMFVDPTISAVAVILIVISSLLMLASQKLQRARSHG
jgi:putative spermidine/putrescine transport system permease protein